MTIFKTYPYALTQTIKLQGGKKVKKYGKLESEPYYGDTISHVQRMLLCKDKTGFRWTIKQRDLQEFIKQYGDVIPFLNKLNPILIWAR